MLKTCLKQVQKHNHETYLTTLFTPAQIRPLITAINAFNIETALIRDSVKDTQIAQLRMKWWTHLITDSFNKTPPNHPVALLLSDSLTPDISKSWFLRILAERSENLHDPQYSSINDIEKYAENTHSSLLYLYNEAFGFKDVKLDHVASHLGRSIGLSTLLRATPHNLISRRFYLPSQLMAKHNLSTQDLLTGKGFDKLQNVVFDVASAANTHLSTARSLSKDMDKSPALSYLFLSSTPTELWLKNLETADFDLYNAKLHQRNWRLPFALFRAFNR